MSYLYICALSLHVCPIPACVPYLCMCALSLHVCPISGSTLLFMAWGPPSPIQVRKLRPNEVKWLVVAFELRQGLLCITWLWIFIFTSADGAISLPSSGCFSKLSSTASNLGAFGLEDGSAHRHHPVPPCLSDEREPRAMISLILNPSPHWF